jgi:hypothetical protein
MQMLTRSQATPLILGQQGSTLDLVMNTLYFTSKPPETMPMSEANRVDETGFADAIPIYNRYTAQGFPIVGTTLAPPRHLSITYRFEPLRDTFIPLICTIVRGENRPSNGVFRISHTGLKILNLKALLYESIDFEFSSDLMAEHTLECMITIGIKAPRELCTRRHPVKAVESARIHMQLSWDTGRQQPLRIGDVLVQE